MIDFEVFFLNRITIPGRVVQTGLVRTTSACSDEVSALRWTSKSRALMRVLFSYYFKASIAFLLWIAFFSLFTSSCLIFASNQGKLAKQKSKRWERMEKTSAHLEVRLGWSRHYRAFSRIKVASAQGPWSCTRSYISNSPHCPKMGLLKLIAWAHPMQRSLNLPQVVLKQRRNALSSHG